MWALGLSKICLVYRVKVMKRSAMQNGEGMKFFNWIWDKPAGHTSLICSTDSPAPCIEFVSSSLSTRSGWPTWMYVEVVLPRNALTVSGCPRILRRNAVRHLESMFALIRCQSRSVMPNRCTKWPTSFQEVWANIVKLCETTVLTRVQKNPGFF